VKRAFPFKTGRIHGSRRDNHRSSTFASPDPQQIANGQHDVLRPDVIVVSITRLKLCLLQKVT
jgi:hypothetical protein